MPTSSGSLSSPTLGDRFCIPSERLVDISHLTSPKQNSRIFPVQMCFSCLFYLCKQHQHPPSYQSKILGVVLNSALFLGLPLRHQQILQGSPFQRHPRTISMAKTIQATSHLSDGCSSTLGDIFCSFLTDTRETLHIS